MRFLWPRMTNEGTVLRRTGRVLFWLGFGVFALCLAVTLFSVATEPHNAGSNLPMGLMFGLPWYLGGRAVCYMLAGE